MLPGQAFELSVEDRVHGDALRAEREEVIAVVADADPRRSEPTILIPLILLLPRLTADSADLQKPRVYLVPDLAVGSALFLDQVGAEVHASLTVGPRNERRRHDVHADQHGLEASREGLGSAQARLHRCAGLQLNQNRSEGHGAHLQQGARSSGL